MSEKKGAIIKLSFAFAQDVIMIYKFLISEKKEFVISKQLLRSGTAIGALAREAQNAESKADFIHKLGIAQKECDESIYWIQLLLKANYIETKDFNTLNKNANSLLKMIRSAIITTKKKVKKL